MVVEQLAIGLVAGIVFGLYGYITKAHDPEKGYESWEWRKATRTTVVYGAAGLVVGYGGDPITQGNIAAATAYTVVLGEIVDKLWARFIKGRLPIIS